MTLRRPESTRQEHNERRRYQMSVLHTAECEQYLLAGQQIPAVAPMALEFQVMSDAEIWAVYYDRLDEDHGTAYEAFLLGLFHLLTPEVGRG